VLLWTGTIIMACFGSSASAKVGDGYGALTCLPRGLEA
jgi:hypothetical protein